MTKRTFFFVPQPAINAMSAFADCGPETVVERMATFATRA
jgi:hypothetical protein